MCFGFWTFFFCRLPLFQGAAFEYVVPLLALQTLYPDRCDAGKTTGKEQIIKCDILVSCKWMTVSQEFSSVPYVLQDIKKKNHLKFLCKFSQSWIYITIYFKISFGDKPHSFVSLFLSLVTTLFNETTGMNFTIVKNATVDEWELIMSHVQYVSIFYRIKLINLL